MADRQMMWKVLGMASGMASAAATRVVLRACWRRAKGGDPPSNPASRSTTWVEAMVWAASSGVALGVARVVAQRGAAEAWKAKTGDYPPGLETVGP